MSTQTNTPSTGSTSSTLLSNHQYDLLKRIVQLILPGLATLYFGLAAIWGLPYGEEIVATFTSLALFGGVLLKFGDRSYEKSDARYDGSVIATGDPEQPVRLEFNNHLQYLMETQHAVVLRVSDPKV